MIPKIFENYIKITHTKQLMDINIEKQEKIWIENILHTKIDLIPVNVKHLTIRLCNLLSLKGLANVLDLIYLDVSWNPIYSMHEVIVHKNLKTLILQNCQIIEVSQVSQLLSLIEFDATNNFIVNSLPLIDHPNFEVKWLTLQQNATQAHFDMYLHHLNNSMEVKKFMKEELSKKLESDYMIKMTKRYISKVKNGKLVVDNDQDMTHFRFTDCIKAKISSFNKCYNINFEFTPKQLKELSITNSKLTSVEGVQKITLLEQINFQNNNIIFIDPIKTLINLQLVVVDGNHIHDIQVIHNLPNFKGNNIKKQIAPTDEIYKKYLGHSFSQDKVNELRQIFEENQYFFALYEYDFDLATHFKQFAQNRTLKIINHNLKSIRFVDFLDIDELNLQNCYQVDLDRTPRNIKTLIMNNCHLTTARIMGLEKMRQLTDLNLGLNALTDDSLEIIGSLNNLRSLDFSINRFESTDKIQLLTQLQSLDLNQNHIKTIDSLEFLTGLENLDISYNQVSKINKLENLVNMIVLNISHNKIDSIQSLHKMTNLVSFDISFNSIISVEICNNFKMLRDLRTQKNKIQDFSTIMSHQNCLQTWQSEQNQLEDHDNVSPELTTRQITDLKMGQKYYQNNEQMLKKYQDKFTNNDISIYNDNQVMNLLFADVHKVKKITIENSENIIFDMSPVYVQVLSVRNSKLQHITNIYQMEQIVDLDLSGNIIRDVSELGALVNLIHLNVSSNDIYRIDSFKELTKLQLLNVSNNKILFCKPIQDLNIKELDINNNLINDLEIVMKMKHFQYKFVSSYTHHHEQSVYDYQQYLGENFGSEESALQFANNYKQQHLVQIQNNKLNIEDQPQLVSIQFVDQLNIKQLSVKQCNNLSLERSPKYLTNLTINNCDLTHLADLQCCRQLLNLNLSNNKLSEFSSICQLTTLNSLDLSSNNIVHVNLLNHLIHLTSINLNNNKILLIQPVSTLQSLKQFSADFNFICDFYTIQSLPHFKTSFITCQNTPSDSDFENYLNFAESHQPIHELQQLINNKNQQSQELVVFAQYDRKMVQKYSEFKSISQNVELVDFAFIDNLNYLEFAIYQCTNVQFKRTPRIVQKLRITSCELTRLNGIEKMTQLTHLIIIKNQISNIDPLKALKNLVVLELNRNKIVNIEPLRGLIGLTHLNIRYNVIQDVSPVNLHPNKNNGNYYLDHQSNNQ
ncbi:Conserved_hypothetical protein [Hexamita inflata]|uniref:Chaoptin n=1 Tax=Hexamita inflata TaxID=28002 RepID=A0AA86PJ16_9EUKA|nr:Conserved hypothetical protein [Hexamita inflata]